VRKQCGNGRDCTPTANGFQQTRCCPALPEQQSDAKTKREVPPNGSAQLSPPRTALLCVCVGGGGNWHPTTLGSAILHSIMSSVAHDVPVDATMQDQHWRSSGRGGHQVADAHFTQQPRQHFLLRSRNTKRKQGTRTRRQSTNEVTPRLGSASTL
jgi:hypothetical protein